MKLRFGNIIKRYFEPGGVVLLYHRVAEPASDVWELSVSPVNFEAQLQLLKKDYHVIPLPTLAESLKKKALKRSVVISFDDGYEDNFTTARPLLEKYELPATFFISAGADEQEGFWWDELENIVFSTGQLPSSISLMIGGSLVSLDIKDEAVLNERQKRINTLWRASRESPPSLRCQLYLRLWQSIKPLPSACQQEALFQIRSWANVTTKASSIYKRMTPTQLRVLANHPLFTIAAHTVTHAALACHEFHYQQQELRINKEYLSQMTGKEISLLSYPYGNYNSDTEFAAKSLGFRGGFTTEEKKITHKSHPFRLGRFQVRNFSASEFSDYIDKWKKMP